MSYNLPDEKGHFAQYGGVFIAETLMTAVTELKLAYEKYKDDADFWPNLKTTSSTMLDVKVHSITQKI